LSEVACHPAYIAIEDQLDAVAQRQRIYLLLRGLMLFVAAGAGATAVILLAADVLGAGMATRLLLLGWVGFVLVCAIWWLAKPLVLPGSTLAVARMVEGEVAGLHDGLSNAVVLSQAADLVRSPWLGLIFDEILANCQKQPLESAVRFSRLGRLSLPVGGVLAVVAALVVCVPNRLAHGWQQIISPNVFVPAAGKARLLEVTPGDVTLVAGLPLDIGIVAAVGATPPPQARVIFSAGHPEARLLAASHAGSDQLGYSYRLDHVDASLRYRVEVGGTQSDWYTVQVVPRISLQSMELNITPPTYTRLPPHRVTLTEKDTAPVPVPAGSRVEIAAAIDVAAQGGVLMIDTQPPLAMMAALANHRFFKESTFAADSTVFVGVLNAGQVIAKVPEHGLLIHAIPDAPPQVMLLYPQTDLTLAPTQKLTIKAALHDDYGIASTRLLVGFGDSAPAIVAGSEHTFANMALDQTAEFPLELTAEQSRHDASITVQVEVTDNRDLTNLSQELGPQTTRSSTVAIRFQDPGQIALQTEQQAERLAARLKEMIKTQQELRAKTMALKPIDDKTSINRDNATAVASGQTALRDQMAQTAATFQFDDHTRIVQKGLQILSAGAATDAADVAYQLAAEPLPAGQARQGGALLSRQQSIVDALSALLARLNSTDAPTTQPPQVSPSGSIPARAEAFRKLDEALKQFEKEQQRSLSQLASLVKKPVDNYDEQDKKKLDDLRQTQEKLDAFLQDAISDFSKNAEQDLSNPSLLKELNTVYTDVTMAKDALQKHDETIAVPAEENGLESAKEIESNIEKWLPNVPDRIAWTQEDPLSKTDTPMPELPSQLEDMIGKLMEQQEDLDQKMEDANANWQDSVDKGIGWDAVDGPIADMSAKGVTGNTLPNDNEMQGRSGDGRTGKSEGEFVGDTASDKGGRNTPTRLEPTPFQAGVIKDTSKGPTGGATGGGKISGQGASGLEGPVPPKTKAEMQRLAGMEAQLRNDAERLNLKYQLGRYDNFKLLQSITNMRRVESDLAANRYQNALRHSDEVVDDLTTSDILLSGGINVKADDSAAGPAHTSKDIQDAAQADLPAAWSQALRQYYQKLSDQ